MEDTSKDPQATPEQPGVDPYQLLSSIEGAPSKSTIDAWKSQACNGRLRIFSLDTAFKRLFILRGISGQEWLAAQKALPSNLAEDKIESALRTAIVVLATSWASQTKGRITESFISNGGAGMLDALYEVVCQLSDFVPPVMIERLSAEL